MQSRINPAELRARVSAADARGREGPVVDLYSELMAYTEMSGEQRDKELEKLVSAANPDHAARPEDSFVSSEEVAPESAEVAAIEGSSTNTEAEPEPGNDNSDQMTRPAAQISEPFRPSGPLNLAHLRIPPLTPPVDATPCPDCKNISVIGDLFCVACGSLLENAG
jgi:hypothetical protein